MAHLLYTGQFKLIEKDIFNALNTNVNSHDNNDRKHTPNNYCKYCGIMMDISGNDYQCNTCGIVKQNIVYENKSSDKIIGGGIKIHTGRHTQYFNINGEYSKLQQKTIYDLLINNNSKFVGPKLPLNIIKSVVELYNSIQKIVNVNIDKSGNVTSKKKYVRRGSIKDEILAALIYFECIKEKTIRKKKDIASFMRLTNDGFSRGEDIVRSLEASGKINIPILDEPVDGFIDRYLETLNINDSRFNKFITDIIKTSEELNLCMTSQLSSKVVGCIWIIIEKCKLDITSTMLEKATDNTKKNTFNKFSKNILINIKIFEPIFVECNIPI